jgi:hypothetical protein
LGYKKTTNYFVIYNKIIAKWFLRISLGNSKRLITKLSIDSALKHCKLDQVEAVSKNSNDAKIILNSHLDIKNLKSLIVTCFDKVIL